MTSGEPAQPSGPSLRLVLGSILILSVVLGVLAYWRFTVSERHIAQALQEMDREGPNLDTEECVGRVLEWHARCEANKPLCDESVARVLTHCLVGRDRNDYCDTLDLSSAKAQWVFQKCEERGASCRDKKRCACASAYRTIDSFCRHGQGGVSL